MQKCFEIEKVYGREIYKEREPLYNKYADIKINCEGKSCEQTVEKIIAALNIKK